MVLADMTVKELCNVLDITDVSFYNKINGKREFTESEIYKLVSLFGNSIFLTTRVWEYQTRKEVSNDNRGKRILLA